MTPPHFKLLVRGHPYMRNSFHPVIVGGIAPATHGADIEAIASLNAFVLVFMTFWMIGATAGGLTISIVAVANHSPAGLVALVLPAAGAIGIRVGFGRHAWAAEQHLRKLLPPPESPPLSSGPFR